MSVCLSVCPLTATSHCLAYRPHRRRSRSTSLMVTYLHKAARTLAFHSPALIIINFYGTRSVWRGILDRRGVWPLLFALLRSSFASHGGRWMGTVYAPLSPLQSSSPVAKLSLGKRTYPTFSPFENPKHSESMSVIYSSA